MGKMEINVDYYSDRSRINNSAIGWFINHGPAYFRLRMDGKGSEESSSAMFVGTVIHKWILQNSTFWDDYRLYNEESDMRMSPNVKAFCEALANTTEIEPDRAVLSAYRGAYSVSSLSDEKVLEKGLELATGCKSYIADLKSTDSREKVGDYQLNLCKTIEERIKNHKLANELLYTENSDEVSVFNEFHINWDFPKEFYEQKIECKSLIDRWMIDHKNKVVTLVDLKTTISAHNFNSSVVKYDYYRQLAFYWCAIMWYMKNELGIDPFEENWDFRTYIVAAQTSTEHTVRVFKIDDTILDNYSITIRDTIEEIAWHKKNNLWDNSKAYYDGDGSEQLTAA